MPPSCVSYLLRRHRPHLEVVWPHEEICNSRAHCAKDVLVKVFRLGIADASFQSSINHALHATDLVFLWQHGNVGLERVGDPEVFAADVGDALVGIPIGVFGKCFVDAIIKVLVVREDDMASDIVELSKGECMLQRDREGQRTNPSFVTSVDARPPGVSLESTISQLAVSCPKSVCYNGADFVTQEDTAPASYSMAFVATLPASHTVALQIPDCTVTWLNSGRVGCVFALSIHCSQGRDSVCLP
jgi:hypothetical protein